MPTISQLPPAGTISAADEVPISQDGSVCAASVGAILASMQPAIIIDSPSLLGRISIGPGSPEQVNIGLGLVISADTLAADGLDHSVFPSVSSFPTESDLVISNQGSPMLMQASLLRGLFSAGANITIDSNGTISTEAGGTATGTVVAGSSISELQVVTGMAAQDLVAVSHSGSDYAIAYSNFLDGVTIDQAQAAGPAGDSDTFWAAQGSNVMVSQTLSALWAWAANKLPTYKAPVVEITTNTNLNVTAHNDRILVCSQPITLTPLTTNMGSGFRCTVINASAGNITLGSGFVTSSGSFALAPWQSATICCATYSIGTIAFAAMPLASSATTATALPGQVTGLSDSGVTSSTITISWQSPSSGGAVASYIVQSRLTGTTTWTSSAPVPAATSYELTALQATTSYDIVVLAQNSMGSGTASAVLTVVTASASQITVPPQVSGLAATPTSSSTIQLGWSAQTGTNAATSFTIQYRLTGSSSWTFSVAGVTGTADSISGLTAGTSYDFSIIGVNSAGAGPVSATATAATTASTAQTAVPAQITGLAATPVTSSSIQLSWSAQTGTNAASTFTVQYRVTGSSSWTSSVAGVSGIVESISGLTAATSYDFSIIGVNSIGSGPVSTTVTAITLSASGSVSSITLNLLPSGTYTHGSGAIGVNALISPAASPVQFGFSLSATTPPTSWTVATLVNTNLWGAYVSTPATAGTWYTWAEGLDGSARTASSSSFLVQ